MNSLATPVFLMAAYRQRTQVHDDNNQDKSGSHLIQKSDSIIAKDLACAERVVISRSMWAMHVNRRNPPVSAPTCTHRPLRCHSPSGAAAFRKVEATNTPPGLNTRLISAICTADVSTWRV